MGQDGVREESRWVSATPWLEAIGVASTALVAAGGLPGPIDGLMWGQGQSLDNPEITIQVATGMAALSLGVLALARLELARMEQHRGRLAQSLAQVAYEEAVHNRLEARRLEIAGQIADRFVRAVDLLASASLDSRIGGIYSLEWVARDSPDHGQSVIDVLCAFLRGHERDQELPVDQIASDIQTALLVVGRSIDYFPDRVINLREADLAGANLGRAQLGGADIMGANLAHSHLLGTDLTGALVLGVDLSGAHIEANFRDAHLLRVNFSHAQLMPQTVIEGARLDDANFNDAEILFEPAGAGWDPDHPPTWPDYMDPPENLWSLLSR